MTEEMKPTRICAHCKTVLERGDDTKLTHGICNPCLCRVSPGAHHFHRSNEIKAAIAAFDPSDGIADLNAFFFKRPS